MTRKLKIVVADDDERDTREYLQEYLTRLGHDVVAAADGRQLVEVCRAFGPDLVSKIGPVTHARLNIFPDGGVSRLRLFGRLA